MNERAKAAAHAIVTAAKQGDPDARAAIAQVLLAADGGDALSAHLADAIEHATAEQHIDLMIAKFVYGAGVDGRPSNTGPLTLGRK